MKTKRTCHVERQAQPRDYGCNLIFAQRNGRLHFSSFYAPCRLVDLGQKELDRARRINIDALLFSEPQSEVREGHVYLFHQHYFQPQYWVLFRIDGIGPSTAN